jgi:hypothetical protein
MAFTPFSNRLPDPNYAIQEYGKGGEGTVGPGFASVKISSIQPTAVSVTNSGRVSSRSIMGHRWSISLSYNPLTREQFEPIYNFLLERRGRLKTFEVVLPQYNSPRTTTSGTINVKTLDPDVDIAAGATNFVVDGYDAGGFAGGLRPGDMFNFNDTNNSNHKKAYRIVRVLTNSDYLTGGTRPATSERVYYTVPSIEKNVKPSTSTITYTNPTFRVMQDGDTREYSLGTNNLYTFNLKLIEAQP